MVSASASSANEQAKDLILVHTAQLKPMIKAHSSGRIVSSGISDVVIASVRFEKTRLKMVMMMIMSKKFFIKKNDKGCRVAYDLKKDKNKGDVELTLSQNKTSNSLKIYDCNRYSMQ